jgi:hypothetical protein
MTAERNDRARDDEETEEAGAEAASIGGSHPDYHVDDAHQAVAEGGGGESEGFEQSEDALERYASHEDPGGNPARDAFTEESGDSGAEYAKGDEEELED